MSTSFGLQLQYNNKEYTRTYSYHILAHVNNYSKPAGYLFNIYQY